MNEDAVLHTLLAKLEDDQDHSPEERESLCREALRILGPGQAALRLRLSLELIQSLVSQCRPELLPEAISLCREILPEMARDGDVEQSDWTTLYLAMALVRQETGDSLAEAIDVLEALLDGPPSSAVVAAYARAHLGKAFARRTAGDPVASVERALREYRLARVQLGQLEILSSVLDMLREMGELYQSRQAGTADENLAAALACYEEALSLAEEAEPEARINAQLGMANLLANLSSGLAGPELTRAVELAERAASEASGAGLPELHATAMADLATIYADAERYEEAITIGRRAVAEPLNDHAGSRIQAQLARSLLANHTAGKGGLEEAEERITAALSTPDLPPLDWAWAARIYAEILTARERNTDLCRAIRLLRQVLFIERRRAPEHRQAETLTLLGNAWALRQDGPRRHFLNRAVCLLRLALSRHPQSPDHPGRLSTAGFLAAALRRRGEHGNADDLEEAITICRQVLSRIDRRHADLRATRRLDLTACYALRRRGNRRDNLEKAIRVCTLCFEDPEASSVRRAQAANNLGLLYHLRIAGSLTENQHRAMRYLEQALDLRREAEHQAPALHNLGNLYAERIAGRADQNLAKAIELLQQAVSIYRELGHIEDEARASLSLARAVSERSETRADQHEAIAACERAFSALGVDGPLATSVMLSLGGLYSKLGQDSAALDRGLQLLTAAEARLDRSEDPFRWAANQNNLGVAYLARAQRLGDDADRRRAADHFRRAAQTWSIDLWPADHRRAQRNLGDLHFVAGEWSSALAAYGAALEAANRIYELGLSEANRLGALQENRDAAAASAFCLARLGDTREAVEMLERWRTRTFADAVELARFQADEDRASERQRRLARRVQSLERELARPAESLTRPADAVLRELEVARRLLSRTRQPASAERAAGADEVLPEPLALLLVTEHGGLTLLVRSAAGERLTEALWSPELTTRDLQALLLGKGERGEEDFYLAAQFAGAKSLDADAARLLLPLGRSLLACLARRLEEIGAASVTLVASGFLGLLPLHAVPLDEGDGAPTFGERFEVGFVPSLRAWVHARQRLQAHGRRVAHLLAVADPSPLPPPWRALRATAAEVEMLAKSFPGSTVILSGERATRSAVLHELPRATQFHAACHGLFDFVDSTRSGLVLSAGERLTLRELRELSTSDSLPDLVVLSACQTAMTEAATAPDEALGLPLALLEAGVPTVVAALWPVGDTATALLMDRFYQEHLGIGPRAGATAAPPRAALGRAQRWLRSVTAAELRSMARDLPPDDELGSRLSLRLALEDDEAQPFAGFRDWAGFVCIGA